MWNSWEKWDFYSEQSEQLDPASSEAQKLLREFQDEIEHEKLGIDFSIIGWEIQLNPLWWFADGGYELSHSSIKSIIPEKHIYKMTLDFKRKKGHMSFSHTEELYFHYNNQNILTVLQRSEKNTIPLNKGLVITKRRWDIREIPWTTQTIQLWKMKITIQFYHNINPSHKHEHD